MTGESPDTSPLVDAPFAFGSEDWFERWLNEHVTYIISEEEESVFRNLTTPGEKELFIERFWRPRDRDLRTAINEC